jgi:cytochrome b561
VRSNPQKHLDLHQDSGLNKTVHEWLSWAMVIGVGLHVLLNVTAFKRYFTQTTGRWVMGSMALILELKAP